MKQSRYLLALFCVFLVFLPLVGLGLLILFPPPDPWGMPLPTWYDLIISQSLGTLLLNSILLSTTVSFLCDHFHLESALMFIAAGFYASNWSEYGGKLIKEVERLSTPVFVVFFTLAGAHLELDKLAIMAIPALLLAAFLA